MDTRSPYLSDQRYENPKEDFRHIAARLEELYAADSVQQVVDIGCANGELLYFLQKIFPRWEFSGIDRNPDFLATARSFHGLKKVTLKQADLYDIEGDYDIVLATCFLPQFPQFEPPLEKLLSLCRQGGSVLATGLFNPYDIDVRVQYCDHTATEPVWINDSNRYSRRRILDWLKPRCRSIEFHDCQYDIEIKHNPDNPARVWTICDSEGNTILINGAWQIANQTLMVIRK